MDRADKKFHKSGWNSFITNTKRVTNYREFGTSICNG